MWCDMEKRIPMLIWTYDISNRPIWYFRCCYQKIIPVVIIQFLYLQNILDIKKSELVTFIFTYIAPRHFTSRIWPSCLFAAIVIYDCTSSFGMTIWAAVPPMSPAGWCSINPCPFSVGAFETDPVYCSLWFICNNCHLFCVWADRSKISIHCFAVILSTRKCSLR